MEYTLRPVAHIRTDFPEKFGIPRQSGLLPSLTARIVFADGFRDPAMLRGIDGYDYRQLKKMSLEEAIAAMKGERQAWESSGQKNNRK